MFDENITNNDGQQILRTASNLLIRSRDNTDDQVIFGDLNFTTKRFRFNMTGIANATVWNGGGADYAEYFLFEEKTQPGDLVGINPKTGKTRLYKAGDLFLGVHSSDPAFVANGIYDTDGTLSPDIVLVGLAGQLVVDFSQVVQKKRRIYTVDGQFVGFRLANDKVFMR